MVLLSNHTESSCVRCIKAARYATYGTEKSGLYNPGRATAGVTYCVQSHPSTVQQQLYQKYDRLYDLCFQKMQVQLMYSACEGIIMGGKQEDSLVIKSTLKSRGRQILDIWDHH